MIWTNRFPAKPDCCNSTDQRPMTRSACRVRLCRMLCADNEDLTDEQVTTIREQCRVQHLSDTAAHWASIEAMDDNAAMLARSLPDWQITDTPEKILQLTNEHNSRSPQQSLSGTYEISQSGENWLLQTRRWIASVSGRLDTQPQLPCSWDVTSDSIVAWVAIQLRASQLILLKSCSVPVATVSELARQGIVDSYLPTLDLQRYATQFACEYLPCTSHERHEKNAPNN